jgi:hypothetical protein
LSRVGSWMTALRNACQTRTIGHKPPVGVAIQFQSSRRSLILLNDLFSASRFSPTLPCLGHEPPDDLDIIWDHIRALQMSLGTGLERPSDLLMIIVAEQSHPSLSRLSGRLSPYGTTLGRPSSSSRTRYSEWPSKLKTMRKLRCPHWESTRQPTHSTITGCTVWRDHRQTYRSGGIVLNTTEVVESAD